MHNHDHECEHKRVKFCPKCKVVYCEDCGREWYDQCKLNHYYPYYRWTWYPTIPAITPGITWDVPTYGGTGTSGSITTIQCDHS